MADPTLYTYPSPLEGYRDLEPLPEYGPSDLLMLNQDVLTTASEKAADGKSYVNPPAEKKSEAYTSFVSPITNGSRGGFEYASYDRQLENQTDMGSAYTSTSYNQSQKS